LVITAIYAGSFDPITRGHEDLIRRSCEFVDHLVVAVAVNSSKKALFTTAERVEMIRAATAKNKHVEVTQFEGLLVDFAKKMGARLNIRGLRAVSDFEYEFQMALMNRHMSETFETVFMVPSVETTYISSSVVREVAQHGGNLDGLVHPAVAKALARKFKNGPIRSKG
jgi:pantetheine-phosphate adenylyltransferase